MSVRFAAISFFLCLIILHFIFLVLFIRDRTWIPAPKIEHPLDDQAALDRLARAVRRSRDVRVNARAMVRAAQAIGRVDLLRAFSQRTLEQRSFDLPSMRRAELARRVMMILDKDKSNATNGF